MSGGPLFPNSTYGATTGTTFWHIYIGACANSRHEEGLGLAASVCADSTWRLRFQLPPTIPTGTMKLRMLSLSSATTGTQKFDATWNRTAVSGNPSSLTMNNEGSTSITWTTGDAGKYKESKVTLDATAAVAGDIIAMDLVFLTSGGTLSFPSVHQPSIIWE